MRPAQRMPCTAYFDCIPCEAYIALIPLKAYKAFVTTHLVQTPAQLSAYLRSLRRSCNLTQEQLGALVGLSQTRIAKIERNPGLVRVDQLLKILSALGVQVALQPKARTGGTRPAKQAADW